MPSDPLTVLAIDPGTHKCGVAILRKGDRHDHPDAIDVLHRSVVATGELVDVVGKLSHEHSPSVILMGNGTSAGAAAENIKQLNIVPVELVDEVMTSVEARKRFFKENPPRGLRRLLPTSLQTPGQPYDDYVAVILAERYLKSRMSFRTQ